MEARDGPPFQALYNVFPPVGTQQTEPAAPTPNGASTPPQSHGPLVLFASGTSTTAGTITVTNDSSGTTVTKPLPANSTFQQCLQILQQAAFQAGLQIQAEPNGNGLRGFGTNNAVTVTQASATVGQF